MPRYSRPNKRVVLGLSKRLAMFRAKSKLSIQVAATNAGLSIPRWRDAESFGLATDATLAQLALIGVEITSLKQS